MHEIAARAPQISVAICTNVYDKYFDQALASIEHQSFKNIEIIIVANGMGDDSFQQLVDRASDSRTRVFRTPLHGVTFSRNIALHFCKAPFVAIMDADDISYPQRLAKQYEFLLRNPEVVVCGSDCDVIGADGAKLATVFFPKSNETIRKQLVWRNPICHPSAMFRADIIGSIGGYYGNSAEDYELWIRLSENADWHFSNIDEALIGYRVPIVSTARRSKRAYAQVAGAQFRYFAITKRPIWLIASFATLVKQLIRAERE